MKVQLQNVVKQRLAAQASDEGAYRLVIRSLALHDGEHVAITGPSGCGKSTTLDLLGMVLRPDSCEHFSFFFEEQNSSVDVAQLWQQERRELLTDLRRRYMGYVLQTGELFPFLSVEENISLAAQTAGVDQATAKQDMEEVLDRLHIQRLRSAKPITLSIGERQRVAIARALAAHPAILLADEPTAALDPSLSRTVMHVFLHLVRARGTTVVMVSHDLNLVHEFAFREVPIMLEGMGNGVMAVLDDRSS